MPRIRIKNEKYVWIMSLTIGIISIVFRLVWPPLKGLRWLVRRYPRQCITMMLGACLALIIIKIFSGQLDARLFTPIACIVFLLFAGLVTSMWPVPKIELIDHKSIPQDDWLSER
jgi:MFS superfamily sulfate permease-like transporter